MWAPNIPEISTSRGSSFPISQEAIYISLQRIPPSPLTHAMVLPIPDQEPPPGASLPFTMPVVNPWRWVSDLTKVFTISCFHLCEHSMPSIPLLTVNFLYPIPSRPLPAHNYALVLPINTPSLALTLFRNVLLFCFFNISEFLNSHPHMLGLVTDHLSTIPCCCFYPHMYG